MTRLLLWDDVPSWAINQNKRVIQKENPKRNTGGVSIREAQGVIEERGSAEVDISNFREESKRERPYRLLKIWGAKAEDEVARERKKTHRIEGARARRAEFD